MPIGLGLPRGSCGTVKNHLICSVLLPLAVASMPCAGAVTAQWVELDNRFLPGAAGPSGLADGTRDGVRYRTFDLFLTVTAPILVLDSGVSQTSGTNPGISLGSGAFFQALHGSAANDFLPSASDLASSPILGFDTFWGLGQRLRPAVLVTQPFQFGGQTAKGTWSVLPGQSETGDALNQIFAGRFTVPTTSGFGTDESAIRRLSGTLFVFSKGATAGQIVDIPNAYAIPSPGALVLAGLGAGLTATRRRRA